MRKITVVMRPLMVGAALMSSGCREPNELPARLAGPQAADEASRSGFAPTGAGVPPSAATSSAIDLASGFQSSTVCNIESIDGFALDAHPHSITGTAQVRGWLGSEDGAEPMQPSLIVADTLGGIVRSIPLSLDIERPDVREAFPAISGLIGKGFTQTLDGASLTGGDYHLFLAYESNGQRFVCDNGRYIAVR